MKYTTDRRFKALATVLFGVLLIPFGLIAPAGAAEDGGYAGAPTRWGVGARPVAMGGAYVAVADGPTGFWWNPAGIAQVRENQAEAAWRAMSFDRQTGYVAYLHPFGREEAAMCFSWTYAGVADLYEYDVDGVRGDQISNYTNAGTFTFGRRFSPLVSLGATIRYVQQNIANIDAYTIGFDLGIHLRFVRDWKLGDLNIPMSKVRIGGAVQRMVEKFPWTTGEYWVKQGASGSATDERVPVGFRTGIAAFVWKDQALVAVDAEFNEKQDARFHAGAEARPHPQLALRAGIDDSDPTFGAGFDVKMNETVKLILDYAFAVQPGPIDAEHVFSLGVQF
jgi:hypothetical protein